MGRSKLFQLWVDPMHLSNWWGPVSWTVIRCELDVRPGGRWRTWLMTSRGEERSIGGQYVEVVVPERLVFTWEFPGGDEASAQVTVVSVNFVDRSDETEIVLEHRKLSSGQTVDMDVGWSSTFDSLTRYLEIGRTSTQID
jgi:uncharacterized protein YndB with AHSA1/START domain